MKIGKLEVYSDQNSLRIEKNKYSRNADIIFYIFFYLSFFIAPIVYVLNLKGLKILKDFQVLMIAIGFLILSIIFLVYNIKRTLLKRRPLILRKINSEIFINDQVFSPIDKLEIIIQRMTDGDGASSFNVGLAADKNFYPVTLDQGKEQAQQLASIIGKYFDKEVSLKDGRMLIP
jgi:hypothetical protein